MCIRDSLTISAGGYTSEIDVNDITELKLLNELPDDSFLRTNGASTDTVSYTHLTSSSRHDLRRVSAIAIITLSPTTCP